MAIAELVKFADFWQKNCSVYQTFSKMLILRDEIWRVVRNVGNHLVEKHFQINILRICWAWSSETLRKNVWDPLLFLSVGSNQTRTPNMLFLSSKVAQSCQEICVAQGVGSQNPGRAASHRPRGARESHRRPSVCHEPISSGTRRRVATGSVYM